MSNLLREQEVKVALINWLYENDHLNGATIINEMVVANWARRADLTIANGKLHAFEIKSDFDSLKRLDGQLSTFMARFEKVSVVCSTRFTDEIKNSVSSHVEVIEFESNDDNVCFKIVKKGKQNIIKDKTVFFDFLLKNEIKNLLNIHGIDYKNTSSRDEMEFIASGLPLSTIREYTIETLKHRYLTTSSAYLNLLNKNKKVSIKHLDLLSKTKQRKSKQAVKKVSTKNLLSNENTYRVDTKKIAEKYGYSKSDIPKEVIKRTVSKEA
ncbi:sce7726 family protein [Proteus mirabilis]|uniref:sce7726 family protein n=1 Tax=Proteus mirabilis TaxID=584 RepID=UPI00339D26D0